MTKKATLEGRKRTSELTAGKKVSDAFDKKAQLLALKQQTDLLGDQVSPKPSKAQSNLLDAKTAAAAIWRQHQRHAKQGSNAQLRFSRHALQRNLIDSIKAAMLEHAITLAGQGIAVEDNQNRCQQFVDDVREYLNGKGLYTNPLTVVDKTSA